MPPSTNRSTTEPTRAAVAGDTAFASTKMPANGGSDSASCERGVWRHDGEDDLAARDDLGDRARVGEAPRARASGFAPPLGGPQHLVSRCLQRRTDRRAHLAGVEQADDHSGGAKVTGSPSSVVRAGVVSATTRPRRITQRRAGCRRSTSSALGAS